MVKLSKSLMDARKIMDLNWCESAIWGIMFRSDGFKLDGMMNE